MEKASPLLNHSGMQDVFVESYNVISPLGNTAEDNFSQLKDHTTAVQLHHRTDIDEQPFWASIISTPLLGSYSAGIENTSRYTRFEKLLIASADKALASLAVDPASEKTIFILSTTKGNISLLEEEDFSQRFYDRMSLFFSAKLLAGYFKNPNTPFVISNACISGSLALLFAKRLLETGQYNYAVVTGADTVSKFVFSGFKAFQALSPGCCKPFSLVRDGINLGEAAATVVLTNGKKTESSKVAVKLSGGAVTNDSNHISGPSRTGNELAMAIEKALAMAEIGSSDVDFISAHGTATLFNDEMEAKAFQLAGLTQTPVNSLKSYFGHTLGAAGLVESVMSIAAMEADMVLPTYGAADTEPIPSINVCRQYVHKTIKHFLKTASGFGGCNAALVFSKT